MANSERQVGVMTDGEKQAQIASKLHSCDESIALAVRELAEGVALMSNRLPQQVHLGTAIARLQSLHAGYEAAVQLRDVIKGSWRVEKAGVPRASDSTESMDAAIRAHGRDRH